MIRRAIRSNCGSRHQRHENGFQGNGDGHCLCLLVVVGLCNGTDHCGRCSAPMALSARFLISGLIAVGVARAMGQSWRLTQPQWRATIIFGLCQNGLYLGLNFVAMQRIEASLAAIIASTMPLLVAALGWAFIGAACRTDRGAGAAGRNPGCCADHGNAH